MVGDVTAARPRLKLIQMWEKAREYLLLVYVVVHMIKRKLINEIFGKTERYENIVKKSKWYKNGCVWRAVGIPTLKHLRPCYFFTFL